jgi:2-polyprenyl-3-methyl-5-hydroxy-6-metoxy-1,4-benzoquinol methylase
MHIYHRPPISTSSVDSLGKIAQRIPRESSVLDLGCATGTLGQYLNLYQDAVVDGIEINSEAAEFGLGYRRIFVKDLESVILKDILENATYSVIVCADILEHLRDPALLLRQLSGLLIPGGKLLISIPNTGYAGIILELLSGEFCYREEGLLDQNHLRFFTRRSFLRLLNKNGFDGTVVDRIILPLEHSEFSYLSYILTKEKYPPNLESLEDGTTYQFIIEAYPHT